VKLRQRVPGSCQQMLKEREGLAGTKGTSIESTEASYRIRMALKSVREDAQKLQDLQVKQDKKVSLLEIKDQALPSYGNKN